jgi:hypothetical protein
MEQVVEYSISGDIETDAKDGYLVFDIKNDFRRKCRYVTRENCSSENV